MKKLTLYIYSFETENGESMIVPTLKKLTAQEILENGLDFHTGNYAVYGEDYGEEIAEFLEEFNPKSSSWDLQGAFGCEIGTYKLDLAETYKDLA